MHFIYTEFDKILPQIMLHVYCVFGILCTGIGQFILEICVNHKYEASRSTNAYSR
jgi:hypothetical protein